MPNPPMVEIEFLTRRKLRVLIRGQYILDAETGEPAIYTIPLLRRKYWEAQFKRTLERLAQ